MLTLFHHTNLQHRDGTLYSTHSSSIVPNLGDTFGPTSSLLSIVISGPLLPVPSMIFDMFFSFFYSSFLSCPVLPCPFRPALSVQSFPMLVYPASLFPFTLLCHPLSFPTYLATLFPANPVLQCATALSCLVLSRLIMLFPIPSSFAVYILLFPASSFPLYPAMTFPAQSASVVLSFLIFFYPTFSCHPCPAFSCIFTSTLSSMSFPALSSSVLSFATSFPTYLAFLSCPFSHCPFHYIYINLLLPLLAQLYPIFSCFFLSPFALLRLSCPFLRCPLHPFLQCTFRPFPSLFYSTTQFP